MHPLFEKYQRYWVVLFWFTWAGINATLNSLSVISDYARRSLEVDWWEPVIWEFSSQISILMLIPLIVMVDRKWPYSFTQLKASLVQLWVFSMAFSLLHVLLMVAMRNTSYWMLDGSYDFGNWPQELLYEYRKDGMTYLWILLVVYTYRFIVSRLISEATVIDEGEEVNQPAFAERFIVKKLGKEFLINTADIEWVEASGNYMNLHVGERCYPLRETMTGLVKRLDPQCFARVHRSYVVNLNEVSDIAAQDSGDYLLNLKNGQQLKLSRRYRDAFKGPV